MFAHAWRAVFEVAHGLDTAFRNISKRTVRVTAALRHADKPVPLPKLVSEVRACPTFVVLWEE